MHKHGVNVLVIGGHPIDPGAHAIGMLLQDSVDLHGVVEVIVVDNKICEVTLALGSNLHDPCRQLRRASQLLSGCFPLEVVRQSRIYQSPPMAGLNQPDYANAVIQCRFSKPHCVYELLTSLKSLEAFMGRKLHAQRWSARVIDCDILLCDNLCIQTPRLTVPHIGLWQRYFVLYPLRDVAPDTLMPTGQTVHECLQQHASAAVKVIGELP